MSTQAALLAEAIALKKAAAIPLYTSPCSFTWAMHDFFLTIEDEMRYVWPGPLNSGKLLYFWVRYYTLAALVFDVAQIHSFSHFQPSLNTCVWMDAMIRVVGALSLWGVEIVMQLRIYALFRLSKRVAVINAVLFVISVAGFIWILVHNGLVRASVIAQAKSLPIPGCPVVHTGIEWAQWVPATIYEGILFGYALWKAGENFLARLRRSDGKLVTRGWRPTLYSVVLSDNLLYFFFIACILTFNNLMVVGVTHIPWFSYGPFHAATGIMTTRMLIHVRKTAYLTSEMRIDATGPLNTSRLGTSGLTQTINLDSTLQWNVASGSRSAGETIADLEAAKENYEMKTASDKDVVHIYDVSANELGSYPDVRRMTTVDILDGDLGSEYPHAI
ncbi:hypothetical protein PYCCODRAFT_1418104 [Trametes coccinea BRFM310]|uniref:DUF6533 domain-containing protein n=1 Tax=Trametes coccinea (strain BRFM310) TaxID=1353009 RepID=A0A1Y2IC56_TRAC3|nr:hypothetical protein PYCCODRAFT_1418104 [Trametes coccinea BRFM310]